MKKVLIVEDEPDFQILLKDAFEKDQFEVILASDGKAGLQAAAQHLPDFIILDLIMPGMNGTTFLTHISTIKGLRDIPIAILSVVPDGVPQKLHDKNLFKNVIGYWIKDVLTPKIITQKVKDYLKNQEKISVQPQAYKY